LALGARRVVHRLIEPEELAEHLAHKASIRLFDGRALPDCA
jgi:hypothetical protein